MLSTPLRSYWDNPTDNNQFLETLNVEEHRMYTMGYIQACHHVQEALADSKTKFLTAALSVENDEARQRMIMYVKLLDTLDESLNERVRLLIENLNEA